MYKNETLDCLWRSVKFGMNSWGHCFSLNPNHKVQRFLSGSLLEGRAKLSVIFGWNFGRNDDLEVCHMKAGIFSLNLRPYWLFYTVHTWLISPWFKESFDYNKFLFDLREIRKNSYFYLIHDLMIKQVITINNVDQGNLLMGIDNKTFRR